MYPTAWWEATQRHGPSRVSSAVRDYISVLVPCLRCLTAASLTQRSIKSKARLGWTEEENLLEAHEFAYFVTIPMPVLPFVLVNQNTTPSLTDLRPCPALADCVHHP